MPPMHVAAAGAEQPMEKPGESRTRAHAWIGEERRAWRVGWMLSAHSPPQKWRNSVCRTAQSTAAGATRLDPPSSASAHPVHSSIRECAEATKT